MKYTVAYLGHTIKKKLSRAHDISYTQQNFSQKNASPKYTTVEILFNMYKNFTFLHQTLNWRDENVASPFSALVFNKALALDSYFGNLPMLITHHLTLNEQNPILFKKIVICKASVSFFGLTSLI